MEQGQDLGRAAPDVFVRLRRWSPSRLPRHTRMRHGLKGTGLVLTPDREPKLRQSPSCARTQAAPPAWRPARSAFLGQSIGIADAHHPVLAPAHRDAGFAPGAAL